MFKISAYSFLISASLWSCIPAYNVSSKEFRKAKADFPKQKVFVANKNLKKEFEILKHSKIYDIVEDSTQVMKITLHPMETRTPACGNPMIGSMMTLGLVPSGFPMIFLTAMILLKIIQRKIINTNYRFIKAFGCLIYSDWAKLFQNSQGRLY